MTFPLLAEPCPVAVKHRDPALIGRHAAQALVLEVETWPKPGLVSHIDNGAHADMDADLLRLSARTLEPFFVALAEAGAMNAGMDRLRQIGIEAEKAMRDATGGVNTHRGAIFGLGLLAAAAGLAANRAWQAPLGTLVAQRWGRDILNHAPEHDTHGSVVARRYQVGGARAEAAAGMPSVYDVARPALAEGRRLAMGNEEAARVHACMALIAVVDDSNLLYRAGPEGLNFARDKTSAFLADGGVGRASWRWDAKAVHEAFVARNLSPGGCADLLAMALFTEVLES
ncbi:putative 2-(5''-triphosphoribosyl)-3'-dephosphocoenzyme-A synthase [Rhizobium sp. NBRC 114257]|uniref:Probable 2-(5''-triphosphoribosyl)-3'-dephosphocoenzyme-A synthase n=1 Tax=Rhizobium dioscoreae TaxID=2653122 RepID=A0ABQ0Z6R0_9HYPH|nr:MULTISPECIES: triphosphoribosyl-dephospho-CoA synthase MdcB [Rhizobium]GES51068.1 putative 2-(5''-triphosphoribosyl)-3'-dephosphocoenzyme-A synthase [Rhizobium dioscoreae]GLU82519.1 putative 2-(5''-triphosphoribosyl)-3'-dephosphocoenzyme-A synthase [Rhizobium sp. NBRC 114257]